MPPDSDLRTEHSTGFIRVRGARMHNLRNVDVDIPRGKLVVLKIEKWIARYLKSYFGAQPGKLATNFYSVDMSSKNPRWQPPTYRPQK